MIKGNKGEWSEIYALFKLLGDKELHPGDISINRIENLVYPILQILRTEEAGNFSYSIEGDIVVISQAPERLRIPVATFKQQAEYLLSQIQTQRSTFEVPETEAFMQSVFCKELKADSGSKTDITIIIHDPRTGFKPPLGFSIKSQLGSPSTLLNAGETTNFIYKITGINLSDEEISSINDISGSRKIRDRITQIIAQGGHLKFIKTQKQVFGNNLVMIDSRMPELLASVLLNFFTRAASSLEELITLTENENPLNFDTGNSHSFYHYKMKRFLTDIALGMMPSVVWTGQNDANGGYLIVKENGDILCYHIYDKNEFENYLLANTKLETASSTKHKFGLIYKESGDLYIKLNLQIRFK